MINHITKLFLFITFVWASIVIGKTLPDLEQNVSSFVLEEKQIIIPGYPDAFNPSIVRWSDGRLLLSFRTRDPLTDSAHLMGFAWLNEEFEVVGKPTLLSIYGERPLKASRAQDPRPVKIGNAFYIVYNNILNDEDIETRRMLVARLHYDGKKFFIINPQYLLNFVGDPKNWREKNWSPFDFNGVLLLSYSLNPHRVFIPLLINDSCETIAVNWANIEWQYGELRGGTPSLLDGDHYLGFFHSFLDMPTVQSNGKKISHYFIGAYRFEAKFPFALTHISPQPIIGSTFYVGPEYPTWKPLRVVFPGGLVFNDKYIWVVYGKQDYEAWVFKMDKQALMNSLIPVKQEKLVKQKKSHNKGRK